MSNHNTKNSAKKNMGGAVVVPFPIELTRAPQCYDPKTAKSAQIVFFLGVRYERLVRDDDQRDLFSKKSKFLSLISYLSFFNIPHI